MADFIRWVDRSFEFDFKADSFSALIERLRSTPDRLEELVRSVSAPILTRRPESGWSIQENVGHLADTEALFDGRLDDFEAGLEELRPADMSNRATEVADHNSREIDQLLTEFRAKRMALVARLESFQPELYARAALHRRLGMQMRLVDQLFFQAEHDDHHLSKVKSLLST